MELLEIRGKSIPFNSNKWVQALAGPRARFNRGTQGARQGSPLGHVTVCSF